MHKTLYIDIDEEITSIIDRVRKAAAMEIIIVAPKNAMLLQGIVNLKLLKKEADRRKKQLMIITQDKIGKKLIEKAGILAQAKAGKDIFLDAEPEEKSYEPMYAEEANEIKEELHKAEQQKEIGSSEYFDEAISHEAVVAETKLAGHSSAKPAKEKKISQAALKKSVKSKEVDEAKSRFSMSDIVISQARPKKKAAKPAASEKIADAEMYIDERNPFNQALGKTKADAPKTSEVSMKKADKFFRGARRLKKDLEMEKVGGGAKKYFFLFAGLLVLFPLIAGAYFLLPKATLELQVKNQEKSISLDLIADAQIEAPNVSDKKLPARTEQITKEISQEYESSGSKEGGAKATGQAVIYNEFSSSVQPLVATTRLETSDGKIFRITKDAVVPGATSVGDETEPGAIEVDVIADQPGENYNIGPADFRISGFKDTPSKFEKFYAKSSKAMSGGSIGEAKLVTAQDIASAKEKNAVAAKKAAIEELKNSLPAGRKIFDDAVQFELVSANASESAGAEKDKFTMATKAKVTSISLLEQDVRTIMLDNLTQSGEDASQISFEKPINYILADFDIEKKTLKFQAKTDAKTAAGLDLENFKKGILGKTTEDAQTYAKNFSAIQKMNISYWPFFVTTIPMNESRVEITSN